MKKTLAILLAAVLTISMALTAILFVASADDEIVLDPKNSENLSIGSVAENYVSDLAAIEGAIAINSAAKWMEVFGEYGDFRGNYYLTADIDLTGTNYSPEASGANYVELNGKLDGCGYTIKSNVPLFTELWVYNDGEEVVVKNLVIDIDIDSTDDSFTSKSIGALATTGGANNGRYIIMDNIKVVGSIKGEMSANATGGLLGNMFRGFTATDIFVDLDALSGACVGGLAGVASVNAQHKGAPITIQNVTVNAAISSVGSNVTGDNACTAGLIGRVWHTNLTIEDVEVYGTITANTNRQVGGLIGRATQDSGRGAVNIKNCTNYANINADAGVATSNSSKWIAVGGIIGVSQFMSENRDIGRYVRLENVVNYGDIVSSTHAGGILGSSASSAAIRFLDCTNHGDVTVTQSGVGAGGIVGSTSTANTFKYDPAVDNGGGSFGATDETSTVVNNGNVVGKSFAGGIVGHVNAVDAWLELCNVENNGAVTAWNAGGILGFSDKNNETFINNAVNNGVVTGCRVGGIVGSIKRIKEMTNCTNNNNVVVMADTEAAPAVGGIIGRVQTGGEVVADSILNLTNNGDIIAQAGAVGAEYVGGIIGSFEIVANINNCDNSGDIALGNVVGGIVGYTIVGTSVDAASVNTGVLNGQQTGDAIGYIYDFDTDTTVPNGQSANIKVMSYNLQSSYRTDERIANVLTVLAENPADVYCFQEADTWLQDLDDLGSQYTIAPGTNSLASDCPIYYNTSTLRHKDSRFYFLMDKGEVVDGVACKHPTYFAYAVFEHKVTGKQFLVINAHLDYGSSSGVRTEQARMILEDRLENDQNLSQYNDLPIIFMGDMNADYQTGYEGDGEYHYDTESTITYLNTQVGLKWAYQMNGVQFVAENIPTFHWYSGDTYTLINNAFQAEFPNDGTAEDFAEENGWSMDKRLIDFIFVSNDGSITPLEYEVIYRNFATTEGYWKYASDHMPITCEMTIN